MAYKTKPDFDLAINNKGLSLAALGRYEEAIQAFNAAINIEPNYSGLYCNRAATFALMNRRTEALTDLKLAIVLDDKIRATAKTNILFKSLCDDPDFQKLVGE